MSKQEATRLADALRRCAPVDFDGDFAAAAALLERWPDGEPVAWVNGDELDNMMDDRPTMIAGKPDGWRRTPLYTAPPGQSERIAALEEELVRLKDAVRSARVDEAHCWSRRNDALEDENAALRADAERWRYVVTHASWYRHDDGRDRYSRMCVRLPYEADQSCVATRTAAIDAARSRT